MRDRLKFNVSGLKFKVRNHKSAIRNFTMKLPRSFYLRSDVVQIAKELLGKYLFTKFNGTLTGGIITETEAYAGTGDRASHAFGGRRTARTEIMFV
jgi:DNA-3-methyladenine glycosylase